MHKEKAKELFLNFLDEPMDSVRRKPNRAIHTSYTFGSGTHKSVRIILLDVRYNKTSLFYDNEADMLGEEQWQWLEEELKNDETFTLIVSGTQILPINRFITEAWYPSSRQRLFRLLGQMKKSGVIFITGDIHAGQILKSQCILPYLGYDIYEFTSSGLSHYDWDFPICDFFLPTDYYLIPTIVDYNFGKIVFNWGNSKEDSSLTISLIDIENITRAEMNLKYRDLEYKPSNTYDNTCEEKLSRRFKTLGDYYEYYKNRKIDLLIYLFVLYLLLSFIYRLLILILKLFSSFSSVLLVVKNQEKEKKA